MRSLNKTIIFFLINLIFLNADAACPTCCKGMGGIRYCDSSAGIYFCQNGDYSSCYCTRHAVMDLQKIAGCCLWQGGVMLVNPQGFVICNNGAVSELCSNNESKPASTMCQ